MQRDRAIKLVQDAILEHEYKSPDEYTLETTPEELGIDSLDMVEICLAIELKTNLNLGEIKLDDLRVVGDLVTMLETRF